MFHCPEVASQNSLVQVLVFETALYGIPDSVFNKLPSVVYRIFTMSCIHYFQFVRSIALIVLFDVFIGSFLSNLRCMLTELYRACVTIVNSHNTFNIIGLFEFIAFNCLGDG